MSSILMRMALSAFALLPAAAQPAPEGAAPTHRVALQSSDSALDNPIEDIADSTRGCAILDKDFPGLRKHAMYGFFKAMSLNQIAAMSHGKITPDMLAQARTDLSALPFRPAAAPQTDVEDPAPPGSQASTSAPK